jgi:hypothetical protein
MVAVWHKNHNLHIHITKLPDLSCRVFKTESWCRVCLSLYMRIFKKSRMVCLSVSHSNWSALFEICSNCNKVIYISIKVWATSLSLSLSLCHSHQEPRYKSFCCSCLFPFFDILFVCFAIFARYGWATELGNSKRSQGEWELFPQMWVFQKGLNPKGNQARKWRGRHVPVKKWCKIFEDLLNMPRGQGTSKLVKNEQTTASLSKEASPLVSHFFNGVVVLVY